MISQPLVCSVITVTKCRARGRAPGSASLQLTLLALMDARRVHTDILQALCLWMSKQTTVKASIIFARSINGMVFASL